MSSKGIEFYKECEPRSLLPLYNTNNTVYDEYDTTRYYRQENKKPDVRIPLFSGSNNNTQNAQNAQNSDWLSSVAIAQPLFPNTNPQKVQLQANQNPSQSPYTTPQHSQQPRAEYVSYMTQSGVNPCDYYVNADDISGNRRQTPAQTEGRVFGVIKRMARSVAGKFADLKSRCFDETENI